MNGPTRRDTLALGAAALATTTLIGASPARSQIKAADVKRPAWPAESGATLRVLRPSKFVDPDETLFRANSEAFSKATGIPVRVDFVGWEDLRPQTAVSASTGAGPDIVLGWPSDPHLYVEKLVPMDDVADYLGRKYGGWAFQALLYGRKWKTDQWISLPMGGSTGPTVYRKSWLKQAGYDTPPDDLEQFLTMAKALRKNGHPVGFALGNAVGDGNGFAQWMLWAHNGYLVDEAGKVALDSKETRAALEFAKALYPEMIEGTLSWTDPSNNKAYAAEQISLTFNGVSIYYAAKNDPNGAALAADTDHALPPKGFAPKPPGSALMVNAMIFKHTKYPNAAKQYLSFMMEEPQYDKWLTGCLGYWSHPLKAYNDSAVWSSDPKLLAYRDGCSYENWDGFKGPIDAAAAAVNANFVLVHMFAAVASGQSSVEDAIKEAVRQAKRYYKT